MENMRKGYSHINGLGMLTDSVKICSYDLMEFACLEAVLNQFNVRHYSFEFASISSRDYGGVNLN